MSWLPKAHKLSKEFAPGHAVSGFWSWVSWLPVSSSEIYSLSFQQRKEKKPPKLSTKVLWALQAISTTKDCKDFLFQQIWYKGVVYRIFSNEYIKFLKQNTSVFPLLSLDSCNPWMCLRLIAKFPGIHEDQPVSLGMLIFLLLFLKTLINWSSSTRCVWCLEAYRAHKALQGWQCLCILCCIVCNRES